MGPHRVRSLHDESSWKQGEIRVRAPRRTRRFRQRGLLLIGVVLACMWLSGGCGPATRQPDPGSTQAATPRPQGTDAQKFGRALALMHEERPSYDDRLKEAKSILRSLDRARLVDLLEETYEKAEPKDRVRAVRLLLLGTDLEGTPGDLRKRMRVLATRALFDNDSTVVAESLFVLLPWRDEPAIQRLIWWRAEQTNDLWLLGRLYQHVVSPYAEWVLLLELERPLPSEAIGAQEWRDRLQTALQWVWASPTDVPLQASLLQTIEEHPPLAADAVRVLARLNGASRKEVTSALQGRREGLPLEARHALDAGLAVLDPSPQRVEHLKDAFLDSVSRYKQGLEPESASVRRCGWLTYVAVSLDDRSLALEIIRAIRSLDADLRPALWTAFIEEACAEGHVLALGLCTLSDDELRSLIKEQPHLAQPIGESFLFWPSGCPSELREELDPAVARIQRIVGQPFP